MTDESFNGLTLIIAVAATGFVSLWVSGCFCRHPRLRERLGKPGDTYCIDCGKEIRK